MLKVVSTEELCEAVHEVANGWAGPLAMFFLVTLFFPCVDVAQMLCL
jgi:hypothetical protein